MFLGMYTTYFLKECLTALVSGQRFLVYGAGARNHHPPHLGRHGFLQHHAAGRCDTQCVLVDTCLLTALSMVTRGLIHIVDLLSFTLEASVHFLEV